MAWTYENTKRGYANLWAKARLNDRTKGTVLARARKLAANRGRYETLEKQTGVPWWWIAIAHNLEGAGNFNTYLGNGQPITQRTTIKPIGRGPFRTFEEGALDAIKLKELDQIKVWDIPRALFLWEQFNGFGYVSKGVNSPYVWSMTNLYTRGKYIADYVYSATAVSKQVGAAAMLLGLIEIGAVQFTKGENELMAELHASLVPFERLAPLLITTLAGPAARLAVSVLADAIEELTQTDTPAKPDVVRERVENLPGKLLGEVLKRAEETLTEVLPPVPVEPQVRAEEPVVAAPSIPAAPAQPAPAAGSVTVQPVSPEPTFLDKIIPAGWKTTLGIVIYVAGTIAALLGYVDHATGEAIATFGAGLAGVGVISKIERWLPLFAGFLKVKRTV